MKEYELKLKKYIEDNNISCEHLIFDTICHSVSDAAKSANASTDDLIKNICMFDNSRNLVVAIVKGDDRVDTKKVANVISKSKIRIANPEQILKHTGYICGGVPSFGYKANFLIDEDILEKDIVLTGGGSEYSLVKIKVTELIKANNGIICDIKK